MTQQVKLFWIFCEKMEQIKRLPLNALKFFYFVGKYGSLTMAAQQLYVTHSAVSKQLKLLEEYFGKPLFLKEGRHLKLTSEGVILYETCHSIFNELQQTTIKLKSHSKSDLIVSCEPTLAMKWLIPRITHFPQHLNFNIIILAAGGAVDFSKQNIDVAIRRNDFTWRKQIQAEWLCDEKIGMVYCTNKNTPPVQIHTHTRPQAWQDWQRISSKSFPCTHHQFFEHFYLSIQAAIAGLGVAIASKWMVQDEIEQGILTAPYGFRKDGSAYYLLSENLIENDERKMLFLKWLREQLSQTNS